MGMTDLQFKAFIKQVKRRLEDVQKLSDIDLQNEKLDEIINDFDEILTKNPD
ncbi:MAG: hypothetical protein LBM87_05435 [Ruminococcus sp.]|jgi:hypothetical protein|nr:hypothetical protein [Ruminococcus sp.]